MEGLSFTTASPVIKSDPMRMDIACFIGFIARRPLTPRSSAETDADYMQRLPSWVLTWLSEHDWNPGWHMRTADDLVALNDIPVLIDSWDAFDSLFSWESRPLDNRSNTCHTAFGNAVRNFFSKGGRRCYVIRIGDPWPYFVPSDFNEASLALRRSAPEALLPTTQKPVSSDRGSWHGIGHLFGLPDVSFLSLPDLPEIFGVESWPQKPEVETVTEERFVEAGTRIEPPKRKSLRSVSAPCCDESGFEEWARFVNRVGNFLSNNVSEVQLLASVPLPADEHSLAGSRDLMAEPATRRLQQTALKVNVAREAQWREVESIQTASVQLVYPWIRNRDTAFLPGDLAPPDSYLAGIIAANALTRGTWRSILSQSASDLDALEPVLQRFALEGVLFPRLRDRVTVLGPTAGGIQILSDVTTDSDENYRSASVVRLMSLIRRAAKVIGEQNVFENNGEKLWNRICDRFNNLLTGLWSEGALAGTCASEAFEVRCDRSTMTQADLDAGRVIVQVSFTVAVPIVRFTVVFAMNDTGLVSSSRQIEASL